jgi:hypothetical protein
MDTETIVRASAAYGVLVRAGIFAYQLKGAYVHWTDPWECEFVMLALMDTEMAKRAARTFLIDCYEAENIVFLKRTSHRSNQFYAIFQRGDLR